MKERVPPRHMGIMAMSKGPYLDPISVVIIEKSQISIAKEKKKGHGAADWGETFKNGTRATSSHIS